MTLLFSRDLEEQCRRLESVLQRLGDAGLKLNARKYKLLEENTVILGHVVSQDVIVTDPEKV